MLITYCVHYELQLEVNTCSSFVGLQLNSLVKYLVLFRENKVEAVGGKRRQVKDGPCSADPAHL